MADMTLYWCPRTRASRAVWMLEEVGANYDLKLIDIRDEAAKADPEFLAISPFGKVPALKIGEASVADSAAICAYLAELYPDAHLAPSKYDPQRGRFHQWMVFGPGCIEPAMAEKFGSTQPNRLAHGWGDFPSVIKVLRQGVEAGPWVLGETFTACDVMLGSGVLFMRQFGILPEDEVLNAYADRCAGRPAYQKAQEIDAKHELS